MKATLWARDLWERWTAPEEWSRRRVAGESALALLLGLFGAMGESGRGWPWMIGAGLAAAVLSLVRRALPAGALVAAGALGGLSATGMLLLGVTGWSAGRRIPGVLRALVAAGLSFLLFEALALWKAPDQAVFVLVFGTALFLVFAVVPGLASRYWTQRRTLLHTLQQRNAQLLREREMVAGQARLRERQRIAQDMHDSLGHQLALIAVQTGALEVDRELTGPQREAVGVLREASVAAMQELREVVGILKDGTPEEEQPVSRVVSRVKELVDAAAAAGMQVALEQSGRTRPLAPAADHTGYRIVQEGLTNAAKHAPGAAIAVNLRYEPDSLLVEVANGPVPPGRALPQGDAVSGGQGLTGLRERARLVGGMVFTGPAAGGGFRLAGVLPYDSAEAREAGKTATFVDADDDFRQQTGAGALGDGGPVIDRLDPREEFKDIMSTKKRNGCLMGCGVGLLILVVLAVAAVFGIGKIVDEADKGMIDPSVYESVTVGEAEQQVREKLPSGKSVLISDLKDKLPAAPAGTSCLSLLSTDTSRGLTTDTVYRFCFKDGKLSEKREFHVKS
ncbi:histidine kinase [Streptomyces sp. SCA3-4]|uniref:sensor histidine kinase n=1 Tax=Streptomyces sichuanensis TaxID=2871810 RepID=UPI001CE3152C|nr:histidine kinase [Streptomyces sichuanensis]MCA6094536.1 histidine kinase [Streptomyces sichuanensis]